MNAPNAYVGRSFSSDMSSWKKGNVGLCEYRPCMIFLNAFERVFLLKLVQVMAEGHLGLSAWMPPPTLGLTARDVDSLHQALILVPRSDSIFGPPLA